MSSCRVVLLSLTTLVLAPALPATWSIIIVDTRTKEVGIASATCVESMDLRGWSPVVLVGSGAAAVQSAVDFSGYTRRFIRDGLAKDIAPSQILAMLAKQDPGHQNRQYGIVDTSGRAAGFTGNATGAWAGDLTGKVGTLVYAIQGNVLTGRPVLKKAEDALRNTHGDLAARLMAAMEAARLMGGDGRCSCSSTNPPGCGSPPKNFTKSAHNGYMIVARQGDRDGGCSLATGCAAGTYYLNHNIVGKYRSDPDPVLQLRKLYDQWRKKLFGRPDHHLSSVTLSVPTLPADGHTTADAVVVLRDLTGRQLVGSAAKLQVTIDASSTASVQIGGYRALGSGVYRFRVRSGSKAGRAVLRIVVDDGKGLVLLSPRTRIDLTADPLWASRRSVSASQGGLTVFVLQGGASRKDRAYLLLASASGSQPGIRISSHVTIPVNPDPVFYTLLQAANSPIFPLALGVLDGTGRAPAGFFAPPGLLLPLQARSLTFAWATLAPIDFASNPVSVGVGQL